VRDDLEKTNAISGISGFFYFSLASLSHAIDPRPIHIGVGDGWEGIGANLSEQGMERSKGRRLPQPHRGARSGALLYEHVTHFQVTVPIDGSAEMRVAAPGYRPWGIRPRGGGTDKVMRGPVRLVRE
jgi:hypothetical protein